VTEQSLDRNQQAALQGSGVDILDWKQVQGIRPSDYEVVIVDTRIAARARQELAYYEYFFVSTRPEIENLLQSGGVVLVFAGPSVPVRVYQGNVVETNYDFLPEGLLSETLLSQSTSGAGSRYEHTKDWDDYFYSKPKYFKTVNVRLEDDKPPFIIRRNPPYGNVAEKIRPLAVTSVTNEMVAGLVAWRTGVIGILPPPNDMFSALLSLKSKGEGLYKENTESLGGPAKAPPWIQNYRSLEHQRLENEAQSLMAELETTEKKLKPFIVASSSLYATSKRLEKAVTKIFSDFDWSVEDLTKTGQPIDYIIRRKQDAVQSLTVALTGTSGFIDSKSGKLAQLMGALPEVGEKGKLVFLVNGSTDVDPSMRAVTSYLTDEALKRLTKNDVCVLLMFDLYRLWIDCLDKGRKSDDVFKSIHETIGLFKYVQP
jgi:hypothetical protein